MQSIGKMHRFAIGQMTRETGGPPAVQVSKVVKQFGRFAALRGISADFNQGLNVQMSYWYLQSTDLGKVSVGRQADASKTTWSCQ